MSELTYLRKLMGGAWIDAEICAEEPTHRLGLQYKRDKNDPWVRHAEKLVKEILTNSRVKFDAHVLADKIKDPYDSTLAEMESAVFLAREGFEIVLEPNAPAVVGPDIRADWDGVPYFVEVRAAGLSEDEERRERLTNQIFAKLTKIPSTYSASFIIGDEYSVDSPRTKAAIAAVIEVLGVLKEQQIKKATFHFAYPDSKLLLPSDGAYSLSAQAREILRNADLVVHFDDLGKEMTGTPASLMKKMKNPPEPVNDHERLKNILHNKRKQLPKASRGIITLEVTEQFMLSDFSVEAALYGDLLVEFKLVNGPHEAIGEPMGRRNNRGFFRKTSRVSAIVIQKRTIEGGQVKCDRKVYPTNRANADTIRLNLAELKRFGEVEDRAHLSAEYAPNHTDENDHTENDAVEPIAKINALAVPPTTLYNQDPEQHRSLEWREVWYHKEESGTFSLVEVHGWWDSVRRETSEKKTRTLGQFEAEAEAVKEMNERVWWLRGRGWIYKRLDQTLTVC